MNILNKILFLSAIFFLTACEDPAVNNNSSNSTEPANDTTGDSGKNTADPAINSRNTDKANAVNNIPDQKDCEITDTHFDKNVFLAKDLAQQIAILATESTKDKDLGDSHRVLRIVNTIDCSIILEKTLPISRSADFPYYLVSASYEPANQIVAIQGFDRAYYYDVKNKKLIGPLEPQFLVDREAVDAQSGMVKGLTVWGHYLLGRSIDFGNFAFDITDLNNPKPVLPVAEYLIPKTEEYNNLFILDAGNGFSQALLPTTDLDAGGSLFDLDKMFMQPLKVNTTVAKNVRNNRYIILNDRTDPAKERKVVIDMYGKKRIDLPESVATKKTGEVLEWLNAQG